jgi:hypothetical protein
MANKSKLALDAVDEMISITAVQPVLHDGELIAPGATAQIRKRDGDALVALGVAERADAPVGVAGERAG